MMNGVLDDALVGLALLISAGYAVSSLGPRSFRRRMQGAAGRALAHAPPYLGLRRLSERLAAASADPAQGGCGGCGGCGSEPKPPAPEVTVPVSHVGRRG
jgi:hypothetical protein